MHQVTHYIISVVVPTITSRIKIDSNATVFLIDDMLVLF